MLFHDQWPEKKKYRATKTDMATMLKKKMVDNVPVTSMLKFETMYHKNTMPIATSVWAVVLIGAGRKKLMTVIKMKAIRGGSTTCTRYIIQFVYQAALWPKALPVQIGEEFLAGKYIVGAHYAVWVIVSVMILIFAGVL